MDALQQSFWTMAERLANGTRLDPFEVADVLGRRLELSSEKPQIIEYEAIGGPAMPFGRAKLFVAEEANRVSLIADVASGIEPPVMDAFSYWYGTHYGVNLADPEDIERLGMLMLRVPVGELHLMFHADDYNVRRVALYNSDIYRWQGPPPPPPPVAKRRAS